MPVQYAIVAFPTLDSSDLVEAVRRRFDPLAAVLNPHITLVFPFSDSAIEARLPDHLTEAVAGFPAFDITLDRPTIAEAGYLFLHVAAGAQNLIALHDRLYSGALARYVSPAHSYVPHVTIGRLSTADRLTAAAQEADEILGRSLVGRVDQLAIFRLDRPLHGAVQFTVPLGASV